MSKKKQKKNDNDVYDEIGDEYSLIDVLSAQSKLFNETGKPLYMDKNFFIKAYYDYKSSIRMGEKKGHICMMPNCKKKPITYSHTLPETCVLRKISDETGHVFYPKHNSITNQFAIDTIGVNLASTFSGFCEEHEQMFIFEQSGNFHNESIFLQNYRVLCRDLFNLRNTKSMHEYEFKKYNDNLLKYHKTLAGKKENINIIKVEDENSKHMRENIEFLDNEINYLNNNIYNDYVKCVINKDDIIAIVNIEVPYKLPMALAGRSNFGIKTDLGEELIFTVVLSILPSDNKTNLIFSTSNINYDNFINLISIYNELSMLSFIESWMVYGTDNWFISPQYWNKLEGSIQRRILSDLLIMDYTPSKELDYSIFSDIREACITDCECVLQGELNENKKKYIEQTLLKEKNKIAYNLD